MPRPGKTPRQDAWTTLEMDVRRLTDNDPETERAFADLKKEGSVVGKAVMTEKQVAAVADLIHCILAERGRRIRNVAEQNLW